MSRFEFGPQTYSVMLFIYLSSLESFYSGLNPFVLFFVLYKIPFVIVWLGVLFHD